MSHGLTGNIKHSNGLLTTHRRRNEKRNIQRRKFLPGYPIKKIFETKEEIDQYMSGDRITCLLCGKSYKALGSHLKVHGLTSDQYKIEYGLPLSVGLDNCHLTEIKSKRFKKMIADGIILNDEEKLKEYRKKAHQRCAFSIRQPFRNKIDADKLNKHIKKNYNHNLKMFTDDDYRKILQIARETNTHPFDICNENRGKMPSAGMLRAKNRENQELKNNFIETIDNLPFVIQAAHQQLGERFIKEVKRLTEEGYSLDQISEYLQVNKQTIVNCRTKHKIVPIKSDYCYRGHKYKNDKRVCSECSTLNKRKKNILPREVARYVIVDKNCGSCGIIIKAKKLGRSYCKTCKNKGYMESQKKYNSENRAKRNRMAQIAYQKRKEKLKNSVE